MADSSPGTSHTAADKCYFLTGCGPGAETTLLHCFISRHSAEPALMLSEYVLSRWRERLGVSLISLEKRDFCVGQNCWGAGRGELLWGALSGLGLRSHCGCAEGIREETWLLQEQTFRNRNKQGRHGAATGSLCVCLDRMIAVGLYTEGL